MKLLTVALAGAIVALAQETPTERTSRLQKPDVANGSVRIEELPWTHAERHLSADAIVLLPIGAAAKEHGPHLKLRNDLTLANHLTTRVMAASPVVVAPALTYHFYPAFLEYPGSTSLAFATARDMTVEVIRSLARHGPRRFYALNTGISTLRPLEAAAGLLAAEGILLHYTDLEARIDQPVRALQQQPGGTHADEIETSMMLYIDASAVDMSKAERDYVPAAPGIFRLTRNPKGAGTYSRTGSWGDPTLATREKGRLIVDALVTGIVGDIDALRKAPLPAPALPAAPAADPSRPPAAGRGGAPAPPAACTAGDERAIRGMAATFSLAWVNHDARELAALWSAEGDIAHPDGSVERTSHAIRQNRASLFMRQEYRASRHFLSIGHIRCLTTDVALADGKWDLRDVVDANRRAVPPMNGLCTLVLKRSDGRWAIEAYRYTVNAKTGATPSMLKQPGFIDK
jgi:creatinine amidohydrolase